MINLLFAETDRITRTAPAGGVIGGHPYKIGSMFGFARATVPAGGEFQYIRKGIAQVACDGHLGIINGHPVDANEGEKVYFKANGSGFTVGPNEGDLHIGYLLTHIPGGNSADYPAEVAFEPTHADPVPHVA